MKRLHRKQSLLEVVPNANETVDYPSDPTAMQPGIFRAPTGIAATPTWIDRLSGSNDPEPLGRGLFQLYRLHRESVNIIGRVHGASNRKNWFERDE